MSEKKKIRESNMIPEKGSIRGVTGVTGLVGIHVC